MDTQLLKNFLILAQTKNFTKAAEKLHRTQSALSLQIARLETLLGQKLFSRDKRNVHLTAAGEELIGHAERLVQLEDELLRHFQKPPIKGNVSFGIPEDLATAYLSTILCDFITSFPKITLNVHCEFTINLLKGFESGAYDIVLIKQDPLNPYPGSQEVWKESLVWVSAKDRHESLAQESSLPLILAPAPCVYRQRALDALNSSGISWQIVYTSPSITGTLAAVEAGLGYTVLPLTMVTKDMKISRQLPHLNEAQIALLKQPKTSQAASQFAAYVIDHIISRLNS